MIPWCRVRNKPYALLGVAHPPQKFSDIYSFEECSLSHAQHWSRATPSSALENMPCQESTLALWAIPASSLISNNIQDFSPKMRHKYTLACLVLHNLLFSQPQSKMFILFWDYIHMTFIIIHCNICSILLFLCLIKLKF